MNGWVKIHRSILDWSWYKDKNMRCLWLHLLLKAEVEETTENGVTLERGTLYTSISTLAREVGLSIQEVRTCLQRMVSDKQLTHESTKRGTKITICNYASYQDVPQSQQQRQQQQINTPRPSLSPAPPISYTQEERNNNPRARENWRHLSSMRMDQLRVTGQSVADFKRSLLLQEVNEVAAELGLSRTDIDAFMQKWGESSPGSDTIRAEYEATFNTKERAKNYKGVGKPVSRGVTVQELMSRR